MPSKPLSRSGSCGAGSFHSPPLQPLLLHGSSQSASRRAPMFESAFEDGVKRPGAREMTAMLAALMALNSFAIDAMIPALPEIGHSLNVANENDRQLVV